MAPCDWRRVARDSPCPICGKPDNCSVSQDGEWVYCGRVEAGSLKQNDGGQYLHRLISPLDRLPILASPPPVLKATSLDRPDVSALAMQWSSHALARPQRERLATILGVSVASLTALGVGWHHGYWTFPERDASGTIIGINRRYPDGTKKRLKNTQAGLTYCSTWDRGRGPILLVEGASDTAALLDLGLTVLGRPSNFAGVHMLADMLRPIPADREIVVIGERDEKPDGRWPGREGAIQTARGLADRLQRPIHWGLPPGEAKDAREWYRNQREDDRQASRFLEGL